MNLTLDLPNTFLLCIDLFFEDYKVHAHVITVETLHPFLNHLLCYSLFFNCIMLVKCTQLAVATRLSLLSSF